MTEVIDAEWFKEYKAIDEDLPVGDKLRNVPDLDQEKQRFITENHQYNPSLRPTIDLDELNTREDRIKRFHAKLSETEVEQVIVKAYEPVLMGRYNALRLLRAADQGDVDTFVAATTETYGPLREPVFRYLGSFLQEYAQTAHDNESNMSIKEQAKAALAVMPDQTSDMQLWPDGRSFRHMQWLFGPFFEDMFSRVELPDRVRGGDAVGVLQKVLERKGYGYTVVTQDKGLQTMAVSHKKQQVKVPENEVYTAKRLYGLIAHEIGIHVEETVEGEKQPLKFLSKGLRGFSAAGEGKGLLVEQLVYENLDDFMRTRRFFDVARRYYATGLARGLDGNGPRDFKEVFAVLHPLDKLWELRESQANPAEAGKIAFEKTWELLVKRTSKGISGRGGAHFQAKIYAEGNLDQWDLLTANPWVQPYLNKGKYDLTKPDHVEIVKAVGVLPVHCDIKNKQ